MSLWDIMSISQQCQAIADEIGALQAERQDLQDQLSGASGSAKAGLTRRINALNNQINLKQQLLDDCLQQYPPPLSLTDGLLVREVSSSPVYVLYDDKKFLIPTPDALTVMGHSSADIHVVPDGTLASLPEVKIDSASPTPGSFVYPPPNDPNPPDYGRHFAITGVNTSIRVVSQRKEVRVIELRGWLYPETDPQFIINGETGWDDWHYYFEVDSVWAVEQGIDLNQILKVGNIIIYVKVARSGLWGAPGKFKALYRVFWEQGASPLAHWESLGGIGTSGPAAALNADGGLVVFVCGTDNAIWHRWQVTRNGEWS